MDWLHSLYNFKFVGKNIRTLLYGLHDTFHLPKKYIRGYKNLRFYACVSCVTRCSYYLHKFMSIEVCQFEAFKLSYWLYCIVTRCKRNTRLRKSRDTVPSTIYLVITVL